MIDGLILPTMIFLQNYPIICYITIIFPLFCRNVNWLGKSMRQNWLRASIGTELAVTR